MELKAIFYARFLPEKGPSVIEQYPAGSIGTRTTAADLLHKSADKPNPKSLLNFSDVNAYIIPPYDLCDKSLSICVREHRVLGWPISLESESYARNRFTFNVCFVLGEKQDIEEDRLDQDERHAVDGDDAGRFGIRANVKTWEQLIKKTALFFKALEVEDGMLAAEEDKMETEGQEGRVVRGLLEKVFEQLTMYSEACVRLSSSHTLNLRLSSSKPQDQPRLPKAHSWDVPLLIRSLPPKNQWTWDLTLTRIYPHINGINHIARIAETSEVDVKFVKRAIRGLVAEGRVKVMDLFHFQASYALTKDWGWFVRDDGMREECVRYVTVSADSDLDAHAKDEEPTTKTKHLLALYTSLTSSANLHDFVLAHQSQLQALNIDIRRFVTFGVLKGFLRRKYKYLIAVSSSTTTTPQGKSSGAKFGSGSGSGSGSKRSNEQAARDFDRAWRKAALSSGWATPPAQVSFSSSVGDGAEDVLRISPEKGALATSEGEGTGEEEITELSPEDEKLRGFLSSGVDGKHCLDEICVAMRMSETKVLETLRSAEGRRVWGEVVVVCK